MSDCIEWQMARTDRGYGRKKVNGKTQRVHRLAWEQVHGPIPEGLCILHSCDNPACYNVEHLFLGTQVDNVRDRDAKGRTGRGPAILTETDIPVIRERFANGELQRVIAASYGVGESTIGNITRGITWRDIRD